MFRVSLPGAADMTAAPARPALTPLAAPPDAAGPGIQAARLVTYGLSLAPSLERVDTAQGSYYAAAGQTQASPGRPLQPVLRQALPDYVGMKAHGALLLAAQTRQETGFDPLVARPVTDTTLAEPVYTYPGLYPLKPFAVNALGERPNLVVVPGQYEGDQLSGTETLFETLRFEVYYAYAGLEDTTPPDIWQVKGQISEGELSFQVQAEDASGIERVVVTYGQPEGTTYQWRSLDLAYEPESGLWKGALSGVSGELAYFVQAVDGAGNLAVGGSKSAYLEPESNDVYLPLLLRK
jgi:hypothetical protein